MSRALLLLLLLACPGLAQTTIKGDVVAGQTVTSEMSCATVSVGEFPPTLVAWFDAADEPTLTISDTNKVDAWRSKVGAHTATGLTTTRPALSGGRLLFDGTDYLRIGGAARAFNADSGEIWMAFRLDSLVTGDVGLSQQAGETAAGYFFNYLARGNSSVGVAIHSTAGGLDSVGGEALSVTVDTDYVVRTYSDGATTAQTLNGVAQSMSVTAGSNTGRWWADADASVDYTLIGASRISGAFAQFLDGAIQEILVDEGVPPAWAVTGRTIYLLAKYSP